MTFSITVPSANQSPGLFPAQNNTNFMRLRDIINQDHNFTASAASNQGTHKQVSLINRSDPGTLPGISSILYSKADNLGASQLWFYNGLSTSQLTPLDLIYPIKFVFANILLKNTSVVVYPNPGFRYAGTGYSIIDDTTTFSYYNLLRSGTNAARRTDTVNSIIAPILSFDANGDLRVSNITSPSTGVTQTIVTSLIINRIS